MRKDRLHTNVKASNGLKNLLLETNVTIPVATAAPALEAIIQQIQRDTVAKTDDHEEAWSIVKGLDAFHNYLLLFSQEGKKDAAAEADSARKHNK